MKTWRCFSLLSLGVVAVLLLVNPAPASAQIQVNSTNPNAAPQGAIGLSVTVAGSGFKKGATAQWFVTGTTNPGGVTVNSTTFNGSTTLTANITVAADATIGGFDVVVTNTDGRIGKGTNKFSVILKGSQTACTTTGTPSGATLVTTLNPVQSNGAAFITTLKLGNAIRVRPLDLNKDNVVDTLVAFVTSGSYSGSSPGIYAFLLDPATGAMQSTNPVSGAPWTNPILVMSGAYSTLVAAGDVNGDGVPDFATGGVTTAPYLFVGSVSASPSYTPSWTAYQISPPPGAATSWGAGIAMGDVDGIGKDEVIVGATSAGGKNKTVPGVYIFKYASGALSYVRVIQDPTGNQGSIFGAAIAIGNIDGKGNDLVVGAPYTGTNGAVYVFPYPAAQSNYFALTGPGPNFGRNLGIADVNLDTFRDLVVITGSIGGTNAQALLYFGTVNAGSTPATLLSAPGLGSGWGDPNIDVADLSASGPGLIAVGSPNASLNSSCEGALHLFSSPYGSSQYPAHVFETPSAVGSAQFEFGYSVGVVPGYPFILIGDHYRDVGTTSWAGQLYVYKLN